jgi:hypothetical protein
MIALVIVNRGECFGLHNIGVKPAVEMIHLVLQNSRISAGRFDHPLRRTNRPSQRTERSTQLQQVLARDL